MSPLQQLEPLPVAEHNCKNIIIQEYDQSAGIISLRLHRREKENAKQPTQKYVVLFISNKVALIAKSAMFIAQCYQQRVLLVGQKKKLKYDRISRCYTLYIIKTSSE